MSSFKVYKCKQIVLEDEIVSGAIVVDENGKINKVLKSLKECERQLKGLDVTEIKYGVIMAGIVDSHVHVNTPGRSDWEDFSCATRAAAAAGVTTICDMPLNSIPSTTTLENLQIKADAAKDNAFVDVAFWGGVVPNNENELVDMVTAGVVGFKCFLCPSGVDEFPHVTEPDLEKALKVLQDTDSVLAFHAECELDNNDHHLPKVCKKDPEIYGTYLSSRPPAMEVKALELISKMSDKYKARLHIVHVSALEGVQIIDDMRKKGVRITAETCPHYLTLHSEEIPPSATHFKCAPPVRNSDNRNGLWKSIKNGSLNMIVSDHSPCTPQLKTNNFMEAWGGISSLQYGLPLIWTQAKERELSLTDITRLMSSSPARLCSLKTKGSLKEGMDADFIVFDCENKTTVTKESILHKNKLTPYLGMDLRGKVLQTYVRGNLVYDNGKFSSKPLGKLLINEMKKSSR